MARPASHIARLRAGGALVILLVLAACARNSEEGLRERLSAWFSLGDTVYFKSGLSCTAAEFSARSTTVKSALRVGDDVARALYRLRGTGVMALSQPGKSPDQWFLDVMNSDRPTGVAVQGAAIEARACMSPEMKAKVRAAFVTPGNLFVFERKTGLFVLFDPARKTILASRGGG